MRKKDPLPDERETRETTTTAPTDSLTLRASYCKRDSYMTEKETVSHESVTTSTAIDLG